MAPSVQETRWEELDALLATPAFTADPYPIYDLLRAEAPIFWSQAWRAWVVTRYDDVRAILRDHRRFSSAERFSSFLSGVTAPQDDEVEALRSQLSVGMIQSDPPVHTRMRTLLSKAFTPRAIEALRPRVRELVDEHLDRVASLGRMDVVRDLAYTLPAIVIGEMLGVPVEDQGRFIDWADDIVAFQGQLDEERIRRASRSVTEMADYCRALCAERRENPADDLLTALVEAQEAGDHFREDELVQTCRNLLVAGHETTRNLISSAVLTLVRHPHQLQLLRGDLERLIPAAVEECLRWESPIQRGWRRVVDDIEIHGRHVA